MKPLKIVLSSALLIAGILLFAACGPEAALPDAQTQTSSPASAIDTPSPTVSASPPAAESAQAPVTESAQPEAASYAAPIQWEDPTIEKAVRSLLDRPTGEITTADLNSITTLSIVGNDIVISSPFDMMRVQGEVTSIQDVSHFNYLMTLQLTGLDITDISPLSSLTNLFTLSLNGNKITDISPLSNHVNLSGLYLRSNEITDIGPLSNLISLTDLDISDNPITDYSPLDSLPASCSITK